jgi:hypothetical protein
MRRGIVKCTQRPTIALNICRQKEEAMGSIPRRHHYIAASYLEGFLEPGEKHLDCYGRKRSAPFSNAPDKLANIRDYHSFKRPDGTIDCSLEVQIEREIETPGIPVIRKLVAGKTNLDYSERLRLAKLIALQAVRVPYERNFMESNHKQNLLSYIEDMDQRSCNKNAPVNAIEVAAAPGADPRLIKEWVPVTRAQILADLRQLEEDPGSSSRHILLGLAADLAKIYMQMEWTIFYATGADRFITSDRPVITISSGDKNLSRGIKDVRSKIIFPLSSAALLQMEHHNWMLDAVRRSPSKAKQKKSPCVAPSSAPEKLVEMVNRMQAARAHLWIFSGRKENWLKEWMKAPLKEPKHVVSIVDEQLIKGTDGGPSRITRKREFVVSHE